MEKVPSPFDLEELLPPRLCSQLRTYLAQSLSKMMILASQEQITQLIRYLALLNKWNQCHSFTAVKDLKMMLTKHLLDSLSVLPYLKGDKILDVGTGPGLPGIPLSILQKDKTFFLLDSRQKTTHFLSQTKNLLSLKNVHLVCQRVQNFQVSSGFSTIVTRAYGKLPKIVADLNHLLTDEGILLAMKGQEEEHLVDTIGEAQIIARQALSYPDMGARRQVVIIQKCQGGGA